MTSTVSCPSRRDSRVCLGRLLKLVEVNDVARRCAGQVSLSVKWLCAPRGPEAELVFSLSWFSRWWRGAGFFFWSNGYALRAGQRQGGVFRIPPPYLWTPLSPQRVKGCSPLTIPKMRSKPKNASRFAKTGCGSQRLLRCRSHPAGRCPNSSSLFPPLAAVVAVAHFSHFSGLRLRRGCYVSAGLYVQQGRKVCCEAANWRNEKKALSAATSFFPFRLPLRGLKGASSPFLVDPARRNRWWFSGSLLTSKENN